MIIREFTDEEKRIMKFLEKKGFGAKKIESFLLRNIHIEVSCDDLITFAISEKLENE